MKKFHRKPSEDIKKGVARLALCSVQVGVSEARGFREVLQGTSFESQKSDV